MKDQMTQLMLDGKIHFATLSRDPRDALDLGTGTGKWAMDFGTSSQGLCRMDFDTDDFAFSG